MGLEGARSEVSLSSGPPHIHSVQVARVNAWLTRDTVCHEANSTLHAEPTKGHAAGDGREMGWGPHTRNNQPAVDQRSAAQGRCSGRPPPSKRRPAGQGAASGPPSPPPPGDLESWWLGAKKSPALPPPPPSPWAPTPAGGQAQHRVERLTFAWGALPGVALGSAWELAGM